MARDKLFVVSETTNFNDDRYNGGTMDDRVRHVVVT